MILEILKIIGCVLTALVGLYATFKPKSTIGFTGLAPEGARGITEIRAIFGVFFIVLGIFPIFVNNLIAYQMLGYGYLLVGIARVVSIFVDKSSNTSNWQSVVFEIVFGIILIL
jgi:uncharacterized membrane protein HdeD (DUF308 family)